MTFFERLQAVLDEKNMTQTDLSGESGIEQPTISRWKNMPAGWIPSKRSLNKLCNATGCTLRWLRDEIEPMFWPENKEMVSCEVKQNPSQTRQPQTTPTDQDQFSVAEMLTLTRVVLESNGIYKPALASNIRAFHQAVTQEGEMQEMRNIIEDMQRQIQELREMMLTPETGQKKSAWNPEKDGERRKAAG